ncbi:MAG: high frequency lysogenization protein HflD [Cellvibrionaceae bacterium]
MTIDLNGQTIALAAIFQFAAQVEQLAKTGHVPQDDFKIAVGSLFSQNPSNTLAVYGKISHLELGLNTLLDSLRRKPTRSNDCIRYVMGILHLQRRLEKQNNMLNIIGSRLDKSRQQAEHFSETHDNVIAGLADIYSDTISTFSFRIQVMGEYQHLQQPRIANQIRTLLFAGVRSAVLWRQLGGRRLKIILNRNKMARIAEQLLEEAKQERLH